MGEHFDLALRVIGWAGAFLAFGAFMTGVSLFMWARRGTWR